MKVKVCVTGPVVTPSGLKEGSLELPDGTTVTGLLRTLGFAPHLHRYFRVAVGEEVVADSAVLQEGDDVTIMLPIGGG